MTRNEALRAERESLVGYESKEINVTDTTFKQLFDEFYEYKKDKVKTSTLKTYRVNIKKLSEFYELKIKDIKLDHYIAWRKRVGNLDLKDKTKNGYYKLLKTILNYGLNGMTLTLLLFIIKWKNFTIQINHQKK
jgi:hypothetical protein